MPVRKPKLVEGEVYHVINRGAMKMIIFMSEYQYHLFLKILRQYTEQYKITLLAVCLMPNHVHILARINEGGDLSKCVGATCAQYSRMVNRFQKRSGTLFQGRFYAAHVSDNTYLKTALRYIHLNPVKAGLVNHPTSWEFSDYREVIGSRSYILGDHVFVRSLFGGSAQYENFVGVAISSHVIESQHFLNDISKTGLL